MKTRPIRHQNAELGTVWFVIPMLWAAVALVGFALIANWPELFAQERAAPSVAATAAPYPGADRPIPQAASASTAGASPSQETAPHGNQF